MASKDVLQSKLYDAWIERAADHTETAGAEALAGEVETGPLLDWKMLPQVGGVFWRKITSKEDWILDSATYERIEKLKVPVADLADGCRQAGFPVRVADAAMRPGVPFSRLAGTAVTVREYLADAPADYASQIADVYDLGRSVARAVLVIKHEVPRFTPMGSGGARVARAHGYVGCVVDGPIRDTQELVDIGFPLFGTSICADSLAPHMMPAGKSVHFEIGNSIAIAGITISPGDAVVADNDGLIAIEPAHLPGALAEADKIVGMEARIFSLLDQGKTFRQVLAILAQLQSD